MIQPRESVSKPHPEISPASISNRLHSLVFESSPDAIAVLDRTGRVLLQNPAFPLLFEVEGDQVQPFERLPATLRGALLDCIEEVHDSRESHSFTAEWPRGSGEATAFEGRISPLPDCESEILFLLVLREVTVRRHLEARLRADADRYRYLTDTISDVIWTMDLDQRITYVSPSIEPLVGRTVNEMARMELRDLLAPESFALAREILLEELRLEYQADLESSPCRTLDLKFMRRDGSTLWCEAKMSFLRDSVGRPVGVLGVARDISAWREAQEALVASEEKLRRAQRLEAVGQLAGGVAHDFNNLLTVIIGNIELMMKELSSDDPHRDQAEEISHAADRAAVLTRQLLAFSRRQMMTPEILDLNEIISQMTGMLRGLVGENVALDLDLYPALDQVKADASQIELALVNLTLNARDAMPEGGRLVIETANDRLESTSGGDDLQVIEGPYVLLAVTDSGKGIDPADQAKIFEPFFTTKSVGKGTGLGLSTVYGIVKQSGGYIWVSSRPGQGSRFEIYLPRAEVGITEADVRAHGSSGPTAKTILLVEDESSVRTLARRLLREQGFEVIEAPSGTVALEVLRDEEQPIDLLVSDVVMPGLSGFELGRQARSLRPHLKVLYMSGHSEEMLSRQGELLEATSLLQKPFSSQQLTQRVQDCLSEPHPELHGSC